MNTQFFEHGVSARRKLSSLAFGFGLAVALLAFSVANAIESISEPDTLIAGQVSNQRITPAYDLTVGVVEWKIQSVDDPDEVFVYRAPIEKLSDGKHYFRFKISHRAAISTFRVEESAVALGFTEEAYNHLEITVNGLPATIRGGATSLSLNQENRGSLQRLDLDVDFEPLDSDGDGIPDWYERRHEGLDPEFPDGGMDGDKDGLTNLQEFWLGTNPNRMDSEFERDGTIDADESDLHRFTLDVPSVVTVYTTGSVDTVGTLLDGEMNALNDSIEDDNARDNALNFQIQKGLAAGPYFVQVASNAGPNEAGDYALFIDAVDGVLRPDLRSGGKASPRSHGGNNRYAPTKSQTTRIQSTNRRLTKVFLSIQNDGDVPDTFQTSMTRLSPKRFDVQFKAIGVGNVTAALEIGRYLPTIEPGRIQRIAGKIRPISKRQPRKVSMLGRIQSRNDRGLIDTNRVRIGFLR